MKPSRRILLAHADARVRRRLILVLIEAGYEVRANDSVEAAVELAGAEWFDLMLIDHTLPGGEGFKLLQRLRISQPNVAVIMLLPKLEVPLVIEGIRLGVTDVLTVGEDPCPVLRRVNALLRPQEEGLGLTAEELAEAEAALVHVGGDAGQLRPEDGPPELAAQLAEAQRARAEAEARLNRVVQEREILAAELQALLEQNIDAARAQAEQAQSLADRTGVALPATGPARSNREQPAASNDGAAESQLSLERTHLEAVRNDLREEEHRIRQEALRVRQEAVQLTQERRRWHEEVEQLQEREANLRAYEQRLRDLQAQVEAARVQRADSTPVTYEGQLQFEAQMRAEWQRIQRAHELLESERAVFRDERMALRDLEATIKQREDRLRAVERALQDHATRASAADGDENSVGGRLRQLARSPFSLWSKGE
jgi:DNA-binding response OmpR family regulator